MAGNIFFHYTAGAWQFVQFYYIGYSGKKEYVLYMPDYAKKRYAGQQLMAAGR